MWSRSVALACGVLLSARPALAAYSDADDLPLPLAHVETVPAGSLVIPMDNTLQAITPPFNLKAYGLVHDLLVNGIPVKWAIKARKAKDVTDFTGSAQRIAPSALPSASRDFAGGPFIVHRDFALLARARIAAYGNSVAVYELTADANVDVRYTLTLRPRIAVSNVNTSIHTDILVEAGISASFYSVVNPVTLSAASCYTSHSEPHTTLTAGVAPVKAFVQSGANFLAQCRASTTYENDVNGRFQTTLGNTINNMNTTLSYPNADLAYSQFVGALNPSPGGSEQDWRFAAGSAFQNNGHVHADNIGASPAHSAATAAKLYSGPGGNVFYLGGHDYGGSSALQNVNGRRMYLNFIFVPSTRPPACDLDLSPYLRAFSGTVYEDRNGDSGLADAVGRPGVRVRFYRDVDDSGLVDTGDVFLAETTTDAAGAYAFSASTLLTGTKYLIAVDSKGVTPSAGLNVGFAQGDVWAEQTYGDNPATPALDVAARFGGRTPATSDNFAASTVPASNNYQHLARADATAGSVTGIHFAFSFNVVTHMRGGDAADDDSSANRTIQGAFRQFIQNANASQSANGMRFVPAVGTNASGGGAWFRIDVTSSLPALTDAGTTVDGRAYSFTDGTTVRDDNPGTLGAGGTVGVDTLNLPTVARPEFELRNLRSTAVVNIGLDLQSSDCGVRRIALYGFGASANSTSDADLRAGPSANAALVEDCVLGASAASFADPGAGIRSVGDHLCASGGDNGTLRNSLIGFSQGRGIALVLGSNGWLLEGNEVRGNAIGNDGLDGIVIANGSGGATVRGNLVTLNEGCGVDTYQGTGSFTIVNNTVSGNGTGTFASETAGIRIYGSGSAVDRNIVSANVGAGVLVTSGAATTRITRNSTFGNGPVSGQLGIDLLTASDDQGRGTAPFVTLNDSGDGDAGANGLFNFPIIASAVIAGPNLVVRGFAAPGGTVEVFLSDGDASGFGEGQTFLFSAIEGSGADSDSGSGTYGPAPINGLAQGTDTTNRFAFSVLLPPAVTVGSLLTATVSDGSGNTSEFSARAATVRWGVVKRSFLTDGTPLANGAVLPKGTQIQFLLYLSNAGGAVSDVGIDDVLDPGFAYVPNSLRFAFTTPACANSACSTTEESAIRTSAVGGTTATDGIDGDPLSFTGGAVRGGNQVVGNGQLDVLAGKVWAVVFTVRMQ